MHDSPFVRMLPPGFIPSLLNFSKDQPQLQVRNMKVEPALGCLLNTDRKGAFGIPGTPRISTFFRHRLEPISSMSHTRSLPEE